MTVENPTDADDFAEFCEEQIANNPDEAAEKIAERYDNELRLAREQVEETRKARNHYIRRCYEMFGSVTTTEIADAFGVSPGTVSDAVDEDPTVERRGLPPKFRD